MNALGKTIAALVFAGLVGAALLGPVLDPAGDNQGPSRDESPSPTKKATPTPEPSPTPANGSSPSPNRWVDIVSNTPIIRRCWRPTRRPGSGLIAAYARGNVRIASPTGETKASFKAKPPLQWSPSGRYLTTAGGRLWTAQGEALPFLDLPPGLQGPQRAELGAWSPRGDCFVFIADDTVWFGALGPKGIVGPALGQGPPGNPLDLAISPDGRRVAVLVERANAASIWLGDLARSRMRQVRRFPANAAAKLLGWSPRGDEILYGVSAGESVAADGIRLMAVSLGRSDRPKGLGVRVLAYGDFIEACGDDLLVASGEGRDTTSNKRLVFARLEQAPEYLTPPDFADVSPACSPDARFIAAIRAPDGGSIDARQLVLLSADGSFLDDLTPEQAGADEYPSWGPAGVVFVMRPASGSPQVWFIPEGGTARPTGLTVRSPRAVYGHLDWGRVLDWSGDTPSGAPPGV